MAIDILVVEDEYTERQELTQLLETVTPPEHIRSAATCSAAIAAISQLCPDLILLDIMLRGRAKVVDAHDLDLRVLQAAAQDHTADPAKSIDTNFNAHHENFLSDGIYQTYGMFSIICTCRKKIKPFFIKFFSFFKSGDMPCFSTGTLL